MARLEAAVTTVETNMFPHVQEQAKPSALKSMEAALNIYQNYKAPMVLSFDSLHHLMVTHILKTKCHGTYAVCVQYF
jgi:hypothetical protein